MKTAKRAAALTHTQELAASWRREFPGEDLDDFLLAIYVMRIGRLLDETYDRMCRVNHRISGADMRILFALRRAGAPYARRPTDLFRSLLVTSGAMTKQVDRLSELGFVDRRPDPAYSGGLLIQLTARGLKIANAAVKGLKSRPVIAPAVAGFTKAERAAVQRLVEQMLIGLDTTAVPVSGTEHYGRRGRAPRQNTHTHRSRSSSQSSAQKAEQPRSRQRTASM